MANVVGVAVGASPFGGSRGALLQRRRRRSARAWALCGVRGGRDARHGANPRSAKMIRILSCLFERDALRHGTCGFW
jgi:hypothetical protein